MKRGSQTYSNEVRKAVERDDDLTFREACTIAGIGPRDCASRSRLPQHVAARDTVVYLLLRSRWTQKRIAGVTKRTERQIKRISKKVGVMSPFRVT